MNCKELGELADSYLSNELLVETNHEVISHLESCAECRRLMAVREEVRSRLRSAVVGADESRIDPAFSVELRSRLRSETSRVNGSFVKLRFAFAAITFLLIAAILASLLITDRGGRDSLSVDVPPPAIEKPVNDLIVPAVLKQAADDAFGDHRDCALSHNLKELPISLENAATTVDSVNGEFDRTVIERLRETFGQRVDLVKAHYCKINGRYFTHVVVRLKKRTTSILLTKLADADGSSPAVCGSDGDLSASCFSSGGYGVYVVADATESETLELANTLSETIIRHISNTRSLA